MELSVVDGEFVVREAKVALQPFEEGGLEDSAASVEGVAREPDDFRSAETQAARVFHLVDSSSRGTMSARRTVVVRLTERMRPWSLGNASR